MSALDDSTNPTIRRFRRKELANAAQQAGLDPVAVRPNAIAELLAAKGLTVLQAAARAEVSFSVMSDMAAKRYGSDVSLTRARRIALALGETVDTVFPPAADDGDVGKLPETRPAARGAKKGRARAA